MKTLDIHGSTPTSEQVALAVYAAAETLDIWECYAHDGRYHFSLGGGWSLALSSDSAGRIRVETCRLTRPQDTMWVLAGRRDRLAHAVQRMSHRVTERV